MKKVIAKQTPTLNAEKMTLGEFNKITGANIYSRGEPTSPGYLILNSLIKPNHSDFPEGGISWISEEDFDAMYAEVEHESDHLEIAYDKAQEYISELEKKIAEREEVPINSRLQTNLLKIELAIQRQLLIITGARYAFSEPCDVIDYQNYGKPSIVRDVSHEVAMLFATYGYPILRKTWTEKSEYVFVVGGEELSTNDETKNKALCRLDDFLCIGSDRDGYLTKPWSPQRNDLNAKDWVVLFK